MYHTILKNNTPVIAKKITFDQMLFLFGVFMKQFYLLPSGSLQIGDIFMLCSFFCYFIIRRQGRLWINKEDCWFFYYFLCISFINGVYALIYLYIGFLKSTLYYLFNMMILMVFAVYVQGENSSEFLGRLRKVLQFSLLTQALIYLFGIGKWYASSRYEGTFNDPNQYGVFIFFSVLIIYLIGCRFGQKNWYWILIGFLLVLPSASTGMLVGFLAFFVTFLFVNNYKKHPIKAMFFCGIGLVILLLAVGVMTGYIEIPSNIQELSVFKRFMAKIEDFSDASSTEGVVTDRGWSRILEAPEYFLFGAGEGKHDRFGSNLEIHSSILGPLFYYGVIPFLFFCCWCWQKVRRTKTEVKCVYIALLAESFFLVNTRQPMFWMILALGGIFLAKNDEIKA